MGVGNYVHRLLGTMIRLCGDELLWKVHKTCINVTNINVTKLYLCTATRENLHNNEFNT